MNNPPLAWLAYFESMLGAKTKTMRPVLVDFVAKSLQRESKAALALKEGLLLPLARKRIRRQYIQQQKGRRHDVPPTL
jgi:hypothetical protein